MVLMPVLDGGGGLKEITILADKCLDKPITLQVGSHQHCLPTVLH